MLKSPPDGHNLVVVVAAHVINASLQAKMPFDPVADVAPVTLIARSPWVIVVIPALPAQNLREFVAYAKANPGKLRFGSSEPSSRLAGEQFKQLAGIDLVHMPYKGGSQIMTDMLGGQIETGFTSTLTALQHYKSGKLRVIAVAGKARTRRCRMCRPPIEAGYPDYETYAWYGMYAPKGTPREVVTRIQQEIANIVRRPDMQERLEPVRRRADREHAGGVRGVHERGARQVREARQGCGHPAGIVRRKSSDGKRGGEACGQSKWVS